ncbi:multiple exostoses 2, partial [Aphelenchoides avenae]
MYQRDAKLPLLENFDGLPHLRAVIVVWNDVGRDLHPKASLRIHVPVYYVNGTQNSLNNRFLPIDLIQTDAVFSMDDDFHAGPNDILFAYRVWRDNPDVLVGPFARLSYIQSDGRGVYETRSRCEYNTVLTGAAFVHRKYLQAYTYDMPAVIREHVDNLTNCEDLAMNFLVANMTGKPPILTAKVTKEALARTAHTGSTEVPRVKRGLHDRKHHYEERAQCVKFFTKVYARNPL